MTTISKNAPVPLFPSDVWCNIYAMAGFASSCTLSATCKKLRDVYLSAHWNLLPAHFPLLPNVKIDGPESGKQLRDHYVALTMARSKHATILPEGLLEAFSDFFAKHIYSICMDKEETLICTVDEEHKLLIWNKKTHERLITLQLDEPIIESAFGVNTNLMFLESENKKIHLWDVKENKCIQTFAGLQMQVSENGNRLVFVSPDDKILEVWDYCEKSGFYDCKMKRKAHEDSGSMFEISCFSMHPAGDMAIIGSKKGSLLHLDLNSGKACLYTAMGRLAIPVAGIQISDDEQFAVAQIGNGTMCYWDFSGGRFSESKTFEFVPATYSRQSPSFNNTIISFKIDSNRKCVLLGFNDGELQYWDLVQEACLKTFKNANQWIHCLELTPDGEIAVALAGDSLQFWNLRVGKTDQPELIGTFYNQFISHIKMQANGTTLLAATWDEYVQFWDLAPTLAKLKDYAIQKITQYANSKLDIVPKVFNNLFPKIQQNVQNHFLELSQDPSNTLKLDFILNYK